MKSSHFKYWALEKEGSRGHSERCLQETMLIIVREQAVFRWVYYELLTRGK